MNEHDSERIGGLLENLHYKKAPEPKNFKDLEADIVVINTCAVRQAAATRLYGNLGQLLDKKRHSKNMIIAVAGCLAQLDRENIIKKAPWVDIVFGTNNLQSLPVLINRVKHNAKNAVEIAEHLEVFPSTLPVVRSNPVSAWVSISVGCNERCTFCIVPTLRGKEIDRQSDDILNEVKSLVKNGYCEITLLGQNVNSYGNKATKAEEKINFAQLLDKISAIRDLKRLRFMSPHPASFTDDVIEIMSKRPNIMPSIHLPLQSGSDKVLKDMKRSYKISHFQKIVQKLRSSIPNIEITTDIIVGFPTETDSDFQKTLEVIDQTKFLSAYTFIYSTRPGTPAARLPQLDKATVKKRFDQLAKLQSKIMLDKHKTYQNKIVKVLTENAHGRKDQQTKRITGREEHGILVHFTSNKTINSGDIVNVYIEYAAPSHLIGRLAEERNTQSTK
jgi:tRNA-2-methylthio-N6-dimethylallyladenosine synthase